MSGNFGTSFIPKKDISTNKGAKIGDSVDFVLLVAVIVFVVTVISSIGVFLYKGFLEKKISQGSVMLKREKDNFDTATIEELVALNKRIKVSQELLDKHLDLTGFFDFLENNTLKSIQFKNLDFSITDGKIKVIMRGVARNYASVVLQSDVFGKHSLIKNPIFSNLDVNDKGDVTFDFSATLDKNLVLYRKRLD